ncbi:glycosyltransferase [Halobium palmae]|uniref:Glycosyltransferase n=1 Tax=Halobium palmae TaxID=1776492 RepID=A0ABD5RV68_9EURY
MSSVHGSATERPFVSVIVPAYNDEEGIRRTLESVTAQTYPNECYEVLAIDNNSTDDTKAVIRGFCEQYPQTVELLVEEQKQGPPAARNKGLEHASGSIIAFIDADMTVDETWLESLADTMQRNEWDYMGCNVEITLEDGRETLTGKYNQIFGFPMKKYIENAQFAGTGCLVVRRTVFDEVGVFDSRLEFSGDREFGDRVYRAGFDQHFQPDITMYHPARASLRDMLAKSFRNGRAQTYLTEYDPDRFGRRSIAHPRNYLPLHPSYFYKKVNRETGIATHEMVLIYLIAYLSKLCVAAGRIYERVTDRGR